MEGDNSQYAGRKFGLIMTINHLDFKSIESPIKCSSISPNGEVKLALTMVKNVKSFLNPAGLKLDIADPNIEKNVYQQFTFGKGEWNTVIDSFAQQGMVWDVANSDSSNPPVGTPFYLFPFHGKQNQRFVFKNNMIYATQNRMVVTYVGGDIPLKMMPASPEMKSRQTFQIQLL